jgi:2-dehydro-3-deoxyglucarate aldolase/4-hydroxy-2-oxoheptanedioate aldolase
MVSEFGTPGLLRVAEAAGVDFVLFDREHTSWTTQHLRTLVDAGRGTDVAVLARVPDATRHSVGSALDAGAAGVMIPMVDSASYARELVETAKFPPLGRRGFGALYADEYLDGDVSATIEFANREQLLIAQVESVRGLDEVEEIAAVDGIDIVWLGHFDLTISMGIAGQFESEAFLEAVQRVVAAAAANDKAAAISAPSAAQAAIEIGRGFRCIAFDDISLFEGALGAAMAATAAAAPPVAEPSR